ncbi:MAG: sensor histidine kinase [Ktedonobacteraceae bacterium]
MQNTSITPQDIARDNERLYASFAHFNVLWLFVMVVIVAMIDYINLSAVPTYLHDWHGPVIILLSVGVLVIYVLRMFFLGKQQQWPLPLRYSLSLWFAVYIDIFLLSLINPGFAWDYWVLFGFSFSLFGGRLLAISIGASILTMLMFIGFFQGPWTGADIGTILGISVSIVSSCITAWIIYRLIGAHYERNRLLEQLSTAHSALEEAHHQLAESAEQERELAVLRERTRVAREMHDTLGHALVLVSVKLEAAQRLRTRDPERCDRELEATKEIVRETMGELRASIANLRSPLLTREPACQAIGRYAREMAQRASLRVTYDLEPGLETLPEQIEETLWKVGQEALTNIEKHAHAAHVALHISREDEYVIMTIADDGVGLPLELCHAHADGSITCTSPAGHYGLSGMVERAEQAGGTLLIHPGKERGTTIEVSLPLAA